MNIGENIKKYRTFRNFTRKDLATKLQVSESTISRYENNKREPNMETLKKISEILEIPPTFLMDDDTLNSYMTDKLNERLKKVSFDKMKESVDKVYPNLEPMIKLLSNPKIEMAYDFSFADLIIHGYEDLLFIAIEKAIINTLKDIKEHEKNGDIFDGAYSWVTKDSPFYEILKTNSRK